MLCALIMAGGKGTRFWPLSTDEKPKQFLRLINDETMIQMTVKRIEPIISLDRIFVCTCESYVDLVKEQLPLLPKENIIVEPEGRNTAPCIALSALIMKRKFPESNMIVLPSDHLIKDEKEFINLVSKANKFVKDNKKSIVTFGMTPNRPEIGYGYIECSSDKEEIEDKSIIKVKRFVEKPNLEKAEEYLKDGNFLWNGGMFLWNIKNIIAEIKMYMPKTYESLKDVENVESKVLQEYINKNYKNTDKISIDYGLLEKAKDIYVIPSDIGWDDVGSWEAIARYKEKDINNNIVMANAEFIDAKENLVVSSNITEIVIHGLDNIYVIENDGKLIIGSKDEIKNIKDIANILRK